MKFQFQFEGDDVNHYSWPYKNGYIKADLQIYINGRVFFNQPHINVVELAIQLGKWLDSVRHDIVWDFIYEVFDQKEPTLFFNVVQESVNVSSALQEYEIQHPLPLIEVVNAVKQFLIALNHQLHEIDYVEKLDRFLDDRVTENTKAITLFEQNNYDAAFALLKKIAIEAPSVQSLNNLAYMYLREEENMDMAEELLKEVLKLQPKSSFPYMMLGEIAVHKKQYEQAKNRLQHALLLEETEEATYNLAMVHFHLGEYVQAAKRFASCDGDSGLTQLHEVVSWMYAGECEKAKALLDRWNDDAYDYTGAIEIADVYVELGCFREAREHFEKEWSDYVTSPYIVSRYGYTLLKLAEEETCQRLIQEAILKTDEEIRDELEAELDEHWTAEDKEERIRELQEQKDALFSIWEELQNGFVPNFEYDMYPMGGCQLFGCSQHGNAEYNEV